MCIRDSCKRSHFKEISFFGSLGNLSAAFGAFAVYKLAVRPEAFTRLSLIHISDKQVTTENSADIAFKYYGSSTAYTILVCRSDKKSYCVTLNGKEIDFAEREPGIIEITLSSSAVSYTHLFSLGRSSKVMRY